MYFVDLVPQCSCFSTLFPAIKLDLNHPDLRSGTKYYDRVKNALSHELLSDISLRICWTPLDSSICKSSIAKYFADRQYDVQLVETQMKVHQEYSLNMPLLGENTPVDNGEKLFATPDELIEYVGMLSLSCNLERDEYLNSFNCDGRSVNVGGAKVIRWNGMFDCHTIVQLLEELKYVLSVQFCRHSKIYVSTLQKICVPTDEHSVGGPILSWISTCCPKYRYERTQLRL